MRVVVDTNTLMMPVECDVRLFDELEKLAEGNGVEGTAASVGRDLVDRCTVVATDADYADDAVLALGRECAYAVTNDGPLRQRLADASVPVICLRGEDKLAITD